MTDKVLAAVVRHSMLKSGDKVVVALSGGCDSVALLSVMLELKDTLGVSVSAAHVNHNLRGAESDRDEAFVKALCQEKNVELSVFSVDVKGECARTGESVELCARRLRYACLEKFVVDGCKVATAHTASDSAETVLFNLARGTSVKGMCGIPPVRDGYIRPLIYCTRNDNEAYCKEHGIDFVTDSTNLDDDCTRNFIRHNIVPLIKQINPSFENAVIRMSGQLSDIDGLLDREADRLISAAECDGGFECSTLLSAEYPVLSRSVHTIVKRLCGITLDAFHTDELCALIASGGKIQLSCGVNAECGTLLRFYNDAETVAEPFQSELSVGELDTPCFKIKTEYVCAKNAQFVNNLFKQHIIDCDKIVGKAIIRNRLEGDRLKIKGRPTKQLRKLMNEKKIPSHLRDVYPVVADEKGVICAVGIGVDERVLPDDLTEKMIIISAEGK